MHAEYAVQITEGASNEFLWRGRAIGDGHAEALARDAFERAHGRLPEGQLVSLEARRTPALPLLRRLPGVGQPPIRLS
jgi:hypothetical protein